MNFLTQAKSQLTAENLTGLSDLLGIEESQVPSLLDEALPTVVSIFQNTSADPEKAPIIDSFLAEVGPDLADEPAELIAAQGKELMRAGKSALAKLLGPRLTDYIAPVAKSTGLGEGKVASALGALAPFVTSLLSTHAKNAAEVHSLLAQKEVTSAAPAEKNRPKEAAPEKSYLPDPSKKKDRRPFPKRKVILALIILALLSVGAYFALEQFVWTETPSEPATTPSETSFWEPLADSLPLAA
jgi:hypothetical protein